MHERPNRRRTGWGRLAAFALVLPLVVTGCEFKGAGVQRPEPTMTDYWQPHPTSIRVYPSTRFVSASGGSILEARIELRDEMGDTVKAAGTVGLELFTPRDDDNGLGRRLYRWDVTIEGIEDQRAHFDSVTRSYLFRLELDERPPTRRTVLRVTFTRASDGRRLEASAPIDP